MKTYYFIVTLLITGLQLSRAQITTSEIKTEDTGGVTSIDGNVGIGYTNPDMKLSVYADNKYIARFHATGDQSIGGVRIGKNSAYGDLINLSNGFGIGAGTYGGNLPLSTENTDHIDFFINNVSRNVGIGTTDPNYKLDVNGAINADSMYNSGQEVWSDFVFKENYPLPSLVEVEHHIKEFGHLQNIPSEEEVLENGYEMGDMDAKLLQKIEELTLYVIDLQKQVNTLKQQLKNK